MIPPRIRELTPDRLGELPESCRACLFWEVSDAARGPDREDPVFALKSKQAWWQAVQLEQPTLSRGAFVDDQLVGYALVGEPAAFPRARRVGPTPHDDALLLGTMWVHPHHRHGGIAKAMLQSILRAATRSRYRALEAYGDVGPQACCMLTVEALEALGFSVSIGHPQHPLLRLDLRRTVSWARSASAVLERVISSLGRRERRAGKPVLEAAADRRSGQRVQ